MIRRVVAAASLTTAFAAVGCGDGGGPATVAQQSTSAPPAATATAPSAVPTTETPTVATATGVRTTPPGGLESPATAPTATTGEPNAEGQEGGAGDEESIRVPAAFRVAADGAITPRQITVPAFLPVALAITSVGERRQVTVRAPGAGTFDVAAGGTARRRLTGLQPGDYAVVAQHGGRATLHVTPGGDAGP